MSPQSWLLLYVLALPLALAVAAISIFFERHPASSWANAFASKQACPKCGRQVPAARISVADTVPMQLAIPRFDQLTYSSLGVARIACSVCGSLRRA